MCFEYCYDQFDIQNETIKYKCKNKNNVIPMHIVRTLVVIVSIYIHLASQNQIHLDNSMYGYFVEKI